MITQDHAYHGHVISCMKISPYKFNKPGGGGCPPQTHVVAVPDIYRGKYRYVVFCTVVPKHFYEKGSSINYVYMDGEGG